MGIDRLLKRAEEYRPNKNQPLLVSPRAEQCPPEVNQPFKPIGRPVTHSMYGNRFAPPLPEHSKGPIRARDARKRKGIQGY